MASRQEPFPIFGPGAWWWETGWRPSHGRHIVIIIVHSATTEGSVRSRLGEAEYSYYFVLREFLPVLERLGRVIQVRDPASEVDPIYNDARQRNEPCVFLLFSAPHYRKPLNLSCPTIPVFAWEFDTIPSETWYGEAEQDWRFVLDKMGKAITHSTYTVRAVQAELGADFPIVSVPAPLWDRFVPFYDKHAAGPVRTSLSVPGRIIDAHRGTLVQPRKFITDKPTSIDLSGVVYLSIFNPNDGRKNISDMIGGFCLAFRDTEDATLVLKLTNRDLRGAMRELREYLSWLMPFKCRVLLLSGYLDSDAYENLVASASFAVNTSHAEGQCLPLMEMMACGKPAIAPAHTAMADYVNGDNAFVVKSSLEPCAWPHDPRLASRTSRYRIDFESLVAAYRESYRVARLEPAHYAQMAENAHESLRRHCSRDVAEKRLADFLARPARTAQDRPEFGKIKPRVDAPWVAENYDDLRVLGYGQRIDEIALRLAYLGAKVDIVSTSRSLSNEAKRLIAHPRSTLSHHTGTLGLNPAGESRAYDLVLISDELRPRGTLEALIPRLHAMLRPGGKIAIVGRSRRSGDAPTRRRKFDPSRLFGVARLFRNRRAFGRHEDELVRKFEKGGFSWRKYTSPLGPHLIPILEFSR